MTPLEPAHIPREEIERTIADYLRNWIRGDETMVKAFPASDAQAAAQLIRSRIEDITNNELVFKNDTYQVNVRKMNFECGETIHLSIKRSDRQTIHDWRDLQEIKNQIVGHECEAVEIYPAESRRVDTANQYHLWCCPDPTFRFPLGFNEGRIVTDKSFGKSVNRPVVG